MYNEFQPLVLRSLRSEKEILDIARMTYVHVLLNATAEVLERRGATMPRGAGGGLPVCATELSRATCDTH